jgi:hypothetical protein
VAVVFDVFFRAEFANELLELVGLEKVLHDAGIRSIANESDIDWRAVFEAGSRMAIVLTKPLSWVDREWGHVLAAAQNRKAAVEVFVPDPGAEGFGVLADQVGVTKEELASDIEQAEAAIGDQWRAHDDRRLLARGSTLEVYRYPATVAMSVVACDDRAWVIVPALVRRGIAEESPTIEARNEAAATLWIWLTAQIQSARTAGRVPVYSKKIR